METERANAAVEQLTKNAKIASKILTKYDGRMVCNWDQTASEKMKRGKQRVVCCGQINLIQV